MSKVSCSISSDGYGLVIHHADETNEDEVMVLAVEDIFSDLDITKRTDDGEAKVSMWARIDPYELALVIQSVLNYSYAKHEQFKEISFTTGL